MIQWNDVRPRDPVASYNLDFEIILNETSNIIDMLYNDVTLPMLNCTNSPVPSDYLRVGLENQAGTSAVVICPGPDCARVVRTGGSVRFTPVP